MRLPGRQFEQTAPNKLGARYPCDLLGRGVGFENPKVTNLAVLIPFDRKNDEGVEHTFEQKPVPALAALDPLVKAPQRALHGFARADVLKLTQKIQRFAFGIRQA